MAIQRDYTVAGHSGQERVLSDFPASFYDFLTLSNLIIILAQQKFSCNETKRKLSTSHCRDYNTVQWIPKNDKPKVGLFCLSSKFCFLTVSVLNF